MSVAERKRSDLRADSMWRELSTAVAWAVQERQGTDTIVLYQVGNAAHRRRMSVETLYDKYYPINPILDAPVPRATMVTEVVEWAYAIHSKAHKRKKYKGEDLLQYKQLCLLAGEVPPNDATTPKQQ